MVQLNSKTPSASKTASISPHESSSWILFLCTYIEINFCLYDTQGERMHSEYLCSNILHVYSHHKVFMQSA